MIPLKDDIPRRGLPLLTLILIAACATAWLLFEDGRPGILYLAGSMLFLWLFGPALEDAAGALRFLGFCLAGGGVALLVQLALDPGPASVSVGASGALAAVIGGYVLLYPRARVTAFVLVPFAATVTQVPALALVGLWVLLQVAYGVFGAAEPLAVVLITQLAGFAFGLAAIRLVTTGWRWPAPSY